jgi:hypothetical protein
MPDFDIQQTPGSDNHVVRRGSLGLVDNENSIQTRLGHNSILPDQGHSRTLVGLPDDRLQFLDHPITNLPKAAVDRETGCIPVSAPPERLGY